MNLCLKDIEMLKTTKNSTIEKCSESNSLTSNTLMQGGKIKKI
jgi:hypothetical protein